MHVHPESFVTSSISVDQELRGAGASDTSCNRTVAGQEWLNDFVHSLKKLKLWTLPCQERFKFGACDLVVCKTACFIPDSIHEAPAVMRVSVTPRKLMLLIGKDTLRVSEARFDLKNNIGFFWVLEIFSAKCCEKVAQDTWRFHCCLVRLGSFMIRLSHRRLRAHLFSLRNVTSDAFSVKRVPPGSRTIRDVMITSGRGSIQKSYFPAFASDKGHCV